MTAESPSTTDRLAEAEPLSDEYLERIRSNAETWRETHDVMPDELMDIDVLLAEVDRSRAAADREYRERIEFTSRLGFGDDKTERAARLPEIIDSVEEAFTAARDHYECPYYCNLCGERLADKDCEECHGAGGHLVQGAYSECSGCGGDMRIHEGCAERSYADLVKERDEARAEADRLRARLDTAEGRIAQAADRHYPQDIYLEFHESAVESSKRTVCVECSGHPVPWDFDEDSLVLWPCKEAKALGLDGEGSR